jgi:hypothetical protein
MEAYDPQTGKTFEFSGDYAGLEYMNSSCKDDDAFYIRWIDAICDKCGFSDGIREGLKKMLNKTVEIGKKIIRIGKIIFDSLMKIVKEFPVTIMGVIIGFFLGMLLYSVPLIGWLLGTILMPIAVAVFAALGFIVDLKNKLTQKAVLDTVNNKMNDCDGWDYVKFKANFYKLAGAFGTES